MKYYAVVDNNKKIIKTFGWRDNRDLPSDYPKPEGTVIIGVPQNFAEEIQSKWQDTDVYVKDIGALMDSTKDYAYYFTETEKEQMEPTDPLAELKTQNAEMLLTLVQGGLM